MTNLTPIKTYLAKNSNELSKEASYLLKTPANAARLTKSIHEVETLIKKRRKYNKNNPLK